MKISGAEGSKKNPILMETMRLKENLMVFTKFKNMFDFNNVHN